MGYRGFNGELPLFGLLKKMLSSYMWTQSWAVIQKEFDNYQSIEKKILSYAEKKNIHTKTLHPNYA